MHRARSSTRTGSKHHGTTAGQREEDLSFLAKLVRQTPCYKLLSGSDLSAIPASISSLLDSVQPVCAEECEQFVQAV